MDIVRRGTALSVRGLHVTLGGARILRGVSFGVAPGETLGIVGPNGAGKTTTLRAIMGLIPCEGEILFEGRALQGLAPSERARFGIGYAPDDNRLITAFSVTQNLRFPAEACGKSSREVDARLASLSALLPELRELGARSAGLLSGGQQKMVALARALVAGERALLLDEPFQGLSPALARRVAEALRSVARACLTIVITESSPGLLSSLASRVLALDRGAILNSGEESAPPPRPLA